MTVPSSCVLLSARRAKLLLISSTSVSLLIAVALSGSTYSSADATHTKWIRGYVKDNVGNEISGASVAVTIDSTTHTDLTDGNGFYNTVFLSTEWTVGSSVSIVVTKGSDQTTSSNVTDDTTIQWNNVTYPYEIPEQGSSFGLLLVGAFVGAIAVAMLTFRPRK